MFRKGEQSKKVRWQKSKYYHNKYKWANQLKHKFSDLDIPKIKGHRKDKGKMMKKDIPDKQ